MPVGLGSNGKPPQSLLMEVQNSIADVLVSSKIKHTLTPCSTLNKSPPPPQTQGIEHSVVLSGEAVSLVGENKSMGQSES